MAFTNLIMKQLKSIIGYMLYNEESSHLAHKLLNLTLGSANRTDERIMLSTKINLFEYHCQQWIKSDPEWLNFFWEQQMKSFNQN